MCPPDTPTNQLEDQAEGTATSLRYVGSICRSISSFMTDETNPFVPSSVVFALPCTCPHRHNAIINIAFLIINFNLSIILSFNVFYFFPPLGRIILFAIAMHRCAHLLSSSSSLRPHFISLVPPPPPPCPSAKSWLGRYNQDIAMWHNAEFPLYVQQWTPMANHQMQP